MRHLLTTIIVLLLLGSCGHREGGKLSLLPSSSPEADSLTYYLKHRLRIGLLDDTTFTALETLRSMGKTKAESLKCNFFDALILKDIGKIDSSCSLYRKILSECDSAEYPYLWHTVKSRLCFDPNLPYIEKYMILQNELDYFKSIGDSGVMAVIYNNIYILTKEMGELELSLEYLQRSQELIKEHGDSDLYIINRANEGTTLLDMGKWKEARKTFESIIEKPMIYRNKGFMEIALRNMFISDTTDYTSLLRAYNICDSSMTRSKAIDAALLYEYWKNHGNLDSASYYGHISYDLCKRISNKFSVIPAYARYIELLEKEGKIDSAYNLMKFYNAYLDSMNIMQNLSKIRASEFRQQREQYETALEQQAYRARMNRWVLALLLTIVIVVTSFMVYNHRQKAKMVKIEADLEMERAKRHLAARAMAIEENENLIDETSRRVKSLVEEGRMKRDVAREIENMISLHKAGKMEWESFESLMETVSPAFTRALKERHPDLHPTAVRMAMYIYMGLSNQQIAQMLNIRQESVRQKRWRLARKLDVPEGIILDDYLHSLDNSIPLPRTNTRTQISGHQNAD